MINKLKRAKLTNETKEVMDDETSRLYEGVRSSFAQIRASQAGSRASTRRAAVLADDCDVDDDVDDELEEELAERTVEELDQENADIVAISEGMEFGEDSEEEVDDDNEAETLVTNGVHKYCLNNIYKAGWKEIKEMDIKKVRNNNKMRRARKRKISKFILNKVKEMKEASSAFVVDDLFEEEWSAGYEHAPWADNVHRLRPNKYE